MDRERKMKKEGEGGKDTQTWKEKERKRVRERGVCTYNWHCVVDVVEQLAMDKNFFVTCRELRFRSRLTKNRILNFQLFYFSFYIQSSLACITERTHTREETKLNGTEKKISLKKKEIWSFDNSAVAAKCQAVISVS